MKRKFALLLLLAAFAAQNLLSETISVGAVNCGLFKYPRPGVTEGQYAAGWDALGTNYQTDVFFYGDVGTNIFPAGSRGIEGLDIRVALKDGNGELSVVELPRTIDVEGTIRKTRRYRALRVVRE